MPKNMMDDGHIADELREKSEEYHTYSVLVNVTVEAKTRQETMDNVEEELKKGHFEVVDSEEVVL